MIRAAVADEGPGRASAGKPVERDRPCPQCDGRSVRPLPRYSTAVWHIVRCTACGFVFLRNPPAYEHLVTEFAWEKTSAAENKRREESRPVITRIDRQIHRRLKPLATKRSVLLRRLFRPGRVLDVGCAEGRSVPLPFTPFGIEISKALFEKASAHMASRGGKAIHAPAVEGMAQFPDNYFSGVVLSSIAEHEVQPKPLLRETARVLMDDGAVYVRVPNYGGLNRRVLGARWSGFRYPDHVNYFTLHSLKRMAGESGFALRLLYPFRFPFDDNINAVMIKAKQS